MPADVRNAAASRRTFRKLSTEEEIEIRRARGEISCAECRRLKLKCDKKLPCGSCVRRGCSSVCPNGSLTTGQGTRFVLADTEQLHRKIAEMGQRIRQLEDALAIFQSGVTNETHPLLREELLGVKFGPEVQNSADSEPVRDTIAESMDALGTLTIGDDGESKYFGRSAGSETLMLAGAELGIDYLEEVSEPKASPEMLRLSGIFPFSSGCTVHSKKYEEAIRILYACLPPRPRAWALCETYMEQAAWIFRPLKRDEIIDDILIPIYKAKTEGAELNYEAVKAINPHKVAVLYMIFASGALVDLTLPAYNAEAENYHQYARAALSMRSIFDSPVMDSIQAIALMAFYHSNAGKKYTLDGVWTLLSLGAKLAQSIGLHRDPARWNMDAKTVERRRGLFWEVFSSDLFHSLALGRPPSIRLSYVDCPLPKDEGDPDQLFWHWKYTFTRDVFASVLELTLAANPPSYDTILELDRKVREKILPPSLNVFLTKDDDYVTPLVYMRGCLLSQHRSITMLYIHRSFFAQAVLDHPVNPLRSPYAPSFLAAYRCASVVIKNSISHFERFPDLCMRWWGIWTHLFSAAIIVGSIVTRAPSSTMAPTAFIELGLAVDLFEKGAKDSRRARSGMAILHKLRDKAFQVYSQFRSGHVPSASNPRSYVPVDDDSYRDELAIFGGQTRVVVSKLLTNKAPNWDANPSSPKSTSSGIRSPLSKPNEIMGPSKLPDDKIEDVHPSLMEYMSLFPPSAFSPDFNIYPEVAAQPTLDQSIMNGVSALPQYTASGELSNYSYPQYSLPQQQQYQSMSSAATPKSFSYDPSSTSSFETYQGPQIYPSTTPTSASTPESTDLADLGMMMNGDSGMDQQWMSFMRDSGILDRSRDATGLTA